MNTVLVLESNYGLLIPETLSRDMIAAICKCKVVKLPLYGSGLYTITQAIVPVVRLIDHTAIEPPKDEFGLPVAAPVDHTGGEV